MTAKLCDLQRKELVNVKDGAKIGYVDDAIVDIDTAAVKFLVVHGRLRLFGLLGRQPDIIIPWADIQIIGEDAILVRFCRPHREPKPPKKAFFENLFQ